MCAALGGMEEGVLAASAARWLESYLRAAPEEIGLGLVRALLGDGQAPVGGALWGSEGGLSVVRKLDYKVAFQIL